MLEVSSFKKGIAVVIMIFVFLVGIFVAVGQYVLSNESALEHLVGFVLFLLILLSPQLGVSLVKSHRLVG